MSLLAERTKHVDEPANSLKEGGRLGLPHLAAIAAGSVVFTLLLFAFTGFGGRAGFVVVLTGDIMTMPGLPKVPAAEHIDVDENGVISGLF